MRRQYEDQRWRQYDHRQPQVDHNEQFRQNIEQQRAQFQQALRRDGAQTEHLGNVDVLRDRRGNIRDMEYKSGDVRYRGLGYDANNQLNHVTINSKSHGMQVWTRTGPNSWVDQHRRVWNGDMQCNQETGQFSVIDPRNANNSQRRDSGTQGRDGGTHSHNGGTHSHKGGTHNHDGGTHNHDGGTHNHDGGTHNHDGGAHNHDGGTHNHDGGTHNHDAKPETDTERREADPAKYEQEVEKTFEKPRRITDKDNYRENLFGAAEGKKPVVMTFGRGSDPDAAAHIEAVKRAKEASGGKADFTFVDLDKVDPNSAIGKYAREHIGQEFGTPLTMVFTQKQGEGNTPVIPERPKHWQRGNLDESALVAAVGEAARLQAEREVKTGRERKDGGDKPPEADKPVKPTTTPDDLLKEAIKPWDKQKSDEMLKGMKPEDQLKLYWEAIKLADSKQNPKLSAQMRAMVGFASIGWGAEAQAAGKADEAEKHYLRGGEYMMSAGALNPDMFRYPGFTDKLRNSALPGTAADTIIEKGLSTPDGKWFYPTKDETDKNQNAFQDARDRYIKVLQEEMKKPKRLRRAS